MGVLNGKRCKTPNIVKNEHDCLYFMNKYNNTNGNLLKFYSSLDEKNRTLFSKWVNSYNID
jgi:hypothetical protein